MRKDYDDPEDLPEIIDDGERGNVPLSKKTLMSLFFVMITFLVVPYVLYVFDIIANWVMLIIMIPAVLIMLFVILYLWKKSR